MIAFVLVACGPTASPGPGDSGGAEGTSGTDASASVGASASASASGPGTSDPGGTTASPADTSGDPVTDDGSGFPADECDALVPDCGPGYVCCGSIVDPYVCTAVLPGQCSGEVECGPGSECVWENQNCGIGECVPVTESTSSDGTGDSTSESTSASSTG